MRLSRERLLEESAATGFRPEVLEKVLLLLDLLEAISENPETAGKFALKGGTALNLFTFELPRLSMDIDLNYIGAEDRNAAIRERPRLEETLAQLARRLGLNPQTPRRDHAGVSWTLRYSSALGPYDNIKVDLNYLYRVPLWMPVRQDSKPVGTRQVKQVLLLDEYEIAAGKLAALLARRTSRDLFDAHQLLLRRGLQEERLRLGFTLYGGMNVHDWRTVSISDIDRAAEDLETYLVPLLRAGAAGSSSGDSPEWRERLLVECREALSIVLPLREDERAFLDELLDRGEIKPELLTADRDFSERVRRHPGLLWKARNVREHYGLS